MSYSIANVCAEAGLENILRWVHHPCLEGELRNRVKNKMIRPTTIPQTLEALIFEQAVAREALWLSYLQHREFAVDLRGVQQQRTIGDLFQQNAGPRSIVDNLQLDLLVASGGVLSHAPRPVQTAAMLIDAFEPEGITQLAKDSIFMMPHLGVLAQIHPRAALEVFERDCLIPLGTCIAPRGNCRPGEVCFRYRISGGGLSTGGDLLVGDWKLLPLGVGETAQIEVEPHRRCDMGAGPGRPVSATIHGGIVGVILDGRGRPLQLPTERHDCQKQMDRWQKELNLYAE
jgi:hypothetical protein